MYHSRYKWISLDYDEIFVKNSTGHVLSRRYSRLRKRTRYRKQSRVREARVQSMMGSSFCKQFHPVIGDDAIGYDFLLVVHYHYIRYLV